MAFWYVVIAFTPFTSVPKVLSHDGSAWREPKVEVSLIKLSRLAPMTLKARSLAEN